MRYAPEALPGKIKTPRSCMYFGETRKYFQRILQPSRSVSRMRASLCISSVKLFLLSLGIAVLLQTSKKLTL